MNKKAGPTLFLSLISFLFLLLPAGAEQQPELTGIQFTGSSATEEKAILTLNGSYIPNAFALKDETPRIILDFPNVRHGLKVKQVTNTNGALVKRIRVGMHTEKELKTRVVFDMATLEGVSFKQDFDDKTNTLTIVFSRSTPETAPQKKEKASQKPQQAQEKPPESQPAAPVGETAEKPATPETVVQPQAATGTTAGGEEKAVIGDLAADTEKNVQTAPEQSEATQPVGEPKPDKKDSQDGKAPGEQVSAESKPAPPSETKPAPVNEALVAADATSQKTPQEEESKKVKETPAKDAPAADVDGKEDGSQKAAPAESKNATKSEVAAAKAVNSGAMIGSITFDGKSPKGEMVLFKLNDFHPPTIHGVEEGTPRVICDFDKAQLAESVKNLIKTDGKFIKIIRVTKHKKPERVRVVIDLTPKLSYDLQQVFFKEDNLFVIIVNTMKK